MFKIQFIPHRKQTVTALEIFLLVRQKVSVIISQNVLKGKGKVRPTTGSTRIEGE